MKKTFIIFFIFCLNLVFSQGEANIWQFRRHLQQNNDFYFKILLRNEAEGNFNRLQAANKNHWNGFSGQFAHGGSTGSKYDVFAGFLAIGVAPVAVAYAGPIMVPTTTKAVIGKALVSTTVQIAVNGKVNGLAVLGDAVLTPGAGSALGASAEVGFNYSGEGEKGFYANAGIFGRKTTGDFLKEAGIGYAFGSASGLFQGAVGTHIVPGENLLNKGIAYGYSEFIFQVPNYSFQSYATK